MAANGSKRVKMDAGLFLLATTGAFGLWSAMNTSPTGLIKFVAKDNDRGVENVARDAMLVSMGLIGALAVGIYLLYNRRGLPAAVATVATGTGLYLYYDWLLREGRKPDGRYSSPVAQVQPAAWGAIPPPLALELS